MSTIRTFWPLRELNKRPDFDCSYLTATQLEQLVQRHQTQKLEDFDLYIFSRLHGRVGWGPDPYEDLREKGAKFIYETDDDLTGEYRDLAEHDRVAQTVAQCDAVTVSTGHLGEMMSRYEKPIHVLPNYIDTEFYTRVSLEAPRVHDGLVIGLAGTRSHWGDWLIVKKPLERIVEKYPHVTVACIGYRPEYLKPVAKLFLAPMAFDQYPALLRQLDIRLCPLEDSPFNKSKSPLAALEAMAAGRKLGKKLVGGAIPVCSSELVYDDTIQHLYNGLLVDEGGWFEALEQLVTDAGMRRRMALQGHRWVKKHRDIRSGVQLWANTYQEIVDA